MQSDLGGRRGFLAEGRTQTDNPSGATPDDPESVAPGMQIERGKAEGKRAVVPPATQVAVGVDSRLAPSGLKKMERLQDRPQAMLRNLLKQDARGTGGERPAW